MKKLVWISIMVCLLGACSKAIEEKKEDIILDAMTNGQWYIYSFKEGNTDISSSFSPYTFQFYRDGKVSGFTPETEDKGTWIGDVNTLSIITNFPAASEPVSKLNASWKITNNTWDYVKAETTVQGIKHLLHLKKK
ncbi:MAG: hypothetical protein JNK20_11570 [Flavipsychrobacter sp.]|jgi:hypothetical protein|nr:hypothetical protein [Flavipsychrobacter sp.]